MRQIMPHTSAAFHQLHLLLIDKDNAAVRVGLTVKTYDKAIGE